VLSDGDGNPRQIIDGSGQLGLGAPPISTVRHYVKGAGTGNTTYAYYADNSAAANLFFVRDDGLFGTGTATNAPYNFATSGGKALYVNSSGQFGYNSSLKAHKINIVEAPSVDWLKQLNVVTFNYRKRSENGVYTDEAEVETLWGVIADDAAIVKPDFCSYDSNGNLDGFHYDRLIAPLLKCVQELKAEVDSLKAQINGASA
jgi:hypothetical protein